MIDICRMAVIAFAFLFLPTTAHAQFGSFPDPLDLRMASDGVHATLLKDFSYIDPGGKRWTAKEGVQLDGASIPWPLWSIIGSPWTGKYREASVIHDYYCDKKSAAWKTVHRLFYDGMLANGVDKIQARIMYAAVYRFGPRWDFTYVPECPNCAAIPYQVKEFTPNFDQTQYEQLKVKAEQPATPLEQLEEEADRQFSKEIKGKQVGTPIFIR